MARLNVSTWEQIEKDYPMSNAFDSLKPFFITFKKIARVFSIASSSVME